MSTTTEAPVAEVLATDLTAAAPAGAPAETFAERVFAAALGAQEIQALFLGDRLGWYRALAAQGPLSSAELARATATAERYAREWLEAQAASGWLTADDPAAEATARRYTLGAGAAEVLTDPDSLNFLAPLARFVGGTGLQLEHAAEAYRTGGGVSWEQFGGTVREAQATMNRPLFLHQLAQEILPAVPELDARLRAGARVADVGCGEGWSSIGIAAGYPAVAVDGYDIDAPSVEAARRHAAQAGIGERVGFTTVDAAEAEAGGYDAVFAFECIHDMPDPVSVLASMRRMAAADGFVVVMDELTEDAFTAPAEPWERLLYGFSLTNCLLDGMSHEHSVGTGTLMRPDTMARYATAAGFSRTEVLDVPCETFRFYRLHL